MTLGRYGRINQEQLTDILITDANVHHQVSQSQHGSRSRDPVLTSDWSTGDQRAGEGDRVRVPRGRGQHRGARPGDHQVLPHP